MAKPIRALELHYPMVQFLIFFSPVIKGIISNNFRKTAVLKATQQRSTPTSFGGCTCA